MFKKNDTVTIRKGRFGEYMFLDGQKALVTKVGRKYVHVFTGHRHRNGKLYRDMQIEPRFLELS